MGCGLRTQLRQIFPRKPSFSPYVGSRQFDGRGSETDAMIERCHAVALINSANHEHAHQDLHFADIPGIAREQSLNLVGLIGYDDDVDPGGRNVHSRQVVHDFIDLHNDHPIMKGAVASTMVGVSSVFGQSLVYRLP